MTGAPAPTRPAKHGRTALICVGVAFGMLGASFAAVPLYDLFCKVTGFGGTPMVGTAGAGKILDREMAVRFDANVAPGLGWKFEAESPEIKVKVGATQTVFYKVTNRSDRTVTGIATYNIAPDKGAAYFVKIQCFCFTEQTLRPGEASDSAVVFYVDPAMTQDPNLNGLRTITLSYTYFPAKAGKSLADAATSARVKLQ
jgi:cytochrome c oxidase assembly protein subunit 11